VNAEGFEPAQLQQFRRRWKTSGPAKLIGHSIGTRSLSVHFDRGEEPSVRGQVETTTT
jgi:hypothetical protein